MKALIWNGRGIKKRCLFLPQKSDSGTPVLHYRSSRDHAT